MSASASRPPVSIDSNASAATGSVVRSRAAPACRVITVSVCATESCRSRAIRPRSAWTAAWAARSRESSAATRASLERRTAWASAQAITTMAALATRSPTLNSSVTKS